jgi:hypothetical protein
MTAWLARLASRRPVCTPAEYNWGETWGHSDRIPCTRWTAHSPRGKPHGTCARRTYRASTGCRDQRFRRRGSPRNVPLSKACRQGPNACRHRSFDRPCSHDNVGRPSASIVRYARHTDHPGGISRTRRSHYPWSPCRPPCRVCTRQNARTNRNRRRSNRCTRFLAPRRRISHTCRSIATAHNLRPTPPHRLRIHPPSTAHGGYRQTNSRNARARSPRTHFLASHRHPNSHRLSYTIGHRAHPLRRRSACECKHFVSPRAVRREPSGDTFHPCDRHRCACNQRPISRNVPA